MKNKYSCQILAMGLLALSIAIYTYTQVNDEIVIHWDINGKADGYAPKLILLFLPFLIVLVDWLMLVVMRLDPRKNNIRKSADGYHAVRFIVASVIFICTFLTCIDALYPQTLKMEIIAPFLVGFMIVVIGNILPKLHSNYTIGIRNRWTLENEVIWRKTHRFGGRLWFCGGIMICICSLVFPTNAFFTLLFIICTIIILPNLYAYDIHQKLGKEHSHD